jgi:hypothetical protein
MLLKKNIAVFLQIFVLTCFPSVEAHAQQEGESSGAQFITEAAAPSASIAELETLAQAKAVLSPTLQNPASPPEATAPIQTEAAQATVVPAGPLLASASIGAGDEANEIVDLTKKLLLREIDLERYYLRYRIYGNEEPKSRRTRFFLFQQGAAGAFLGSNIVNTIETAKHFRSPEAVSGRVFARSNRTGVTGSVLGMGSSSLELLSNGVVAIKNKIRKHDPTTARDSVLERLKEIDEIAAQRDVLVARNVASSAHEMYVTEGEVLKAFRDWCVYEFADVFADIKSNQSSNNVFYALDIGAYSTSLASYLLGLRSSKRPHLAFPALHCGFVSDSLFTAEAPATAFANTWLYKYHWASLAKRLHQEPKDTEVDAKRLMHKLEGLAAGADEEALSQVGSITSRLAIYSYWSTRYDKFIDRRIGEIRRQSRIALQGIVSGPLLGVAGLSQDVFNAIGLYKYKNNPFAQNSLAFCGAATSTVSSVASFGLTSYWFADQLKHDHAYERCKLLPEMLMQDRIKTLAVLEEMLKEEKPE